MANPYLSVIIPAYNESRRLPETILDLDRHLSKAEYSYEILVVDDGSTDNTAEIVTKMAKDVSHLKLSHFEQNRGKGAVVRDGMLMAKGKVRLFMDADNATTVDQFERMRPLLEKEKCDVVIGSRALKESRMEPPEPLIRQIPGKMGNLFIQLLLLPGLWDTQCGFKAFTEEAAEKVFKLVKITGWGFDIEALSLAKQLGFKLKEVPVVWVNKEGSKVKASAYLKVLLETIKIRVWLWTGKYDFSKEIKNVVPELPENNI